MLKFIFLTLLIFLSQWGFSQNQSIDSLIQLIGSEKIDSNKYNLCIDVAKAYSDSAYDKSLIYFNKALHIANKSSDRKKLAHIYHQIGYMYQRKGEFTLALQNYNDALTIHKYLNNKTGIGQTLNDIGLIYKTWGKYDKALENYISALQLFDEIGDSVNGAMASNNIGQIFYYRSEYDRAIEYFKKYLEVNKKTNSPRAVAGAANNIASAYLELGRLDEALNYYQISMRTYDSLGIKLGVAIIKDNIGSLLLRKTRYKEALSYHFEALKIFEEIKSQSRICSSMQSIGIAYHKLNKNDQAINYLNRSLEIALMLDQKETQKEVYEALSEAYKSKGLFEKALVNLKHYIRIKDTLLNAETINKIESIQADYESKRRDRELSEINQKLQKQKIILPLSICFLIIFLFMIVLIIRENNKKKKCLLQYNLQKKTFQENLIQTGRMVSSWSNKKVNIESYLTKHRLIKPTNNYVECCPLVTIQKDSIIYFAIITANNQSIRSEVLALSVLDFFEFKTPQSENASIFNEYLSYISQDNRWSTIIEEINSIQVVFWAFDKSLKKYHYSGSGNAYCLINNVLSKICSSKNDEWFNTAKQDQFYFLSLFFNEDSSVEEMEEIVSSIEKTMQGTIEQTFEGRNDILASSLDFLKTRFDVIAEISINAIEI
ncbi:MAG: tetratricopeptide repeat protein [Tenuifilaceae bacterium]